MKEKIHITVLTLWICWLMGLTFASFSSQNWWTKVDNIQSSSIQESFVCSETALAKKSKETKEYNKNIKKMDEFLSKVDSIGGDRNSLKDPCDWLKWKEKTECNLNNVKLKGLLTQVKKLKEKMLPYEECIEKLWIIRDTNKEISWKVETTKKTEKKEVIEKIKDCGIMKEDIWEIVSPESQKKLLCISDAITSCAPAKIAFKNSGMDDVTYVVYKKNIESCAIWFSTNEGSSQCDIPFSTIKDLKKYWEEEDMSDFIITPIAMLIMFREGTDAITGEKIVLKCRDYGPDNKKDTTSWSEWKWSTCTNGSQTRKVECQSDGKKVDEKKCARVIQPSTYQKCTNESDLGDIGLSKNKLYGPWVALTQSEIVTIWDLVQFTSDRGWEYVYSCGKDATRSTNPLHPDSEKLWTFYCTYSSVGKKMVTISHQWKVVASNTFIVKEKIEKPTTKPEQKKYKCTETDEWLDYEKKWSVTGIWDFYTGDLSDPTLMSTHTDMCLNNYGTTNGLPIWLLEYSCDSHGRKTSTDYLCSKWCKEGACIK